MLTSLCGLVLAEEHHNFGHLFRLRSALWSLGQVALRHSSVRSDISHDLPLDRIQSIVLELYWRREPADVRQPRTKKVPAQHHNARTL